MRKGWKIALLRLSGVFFIAAVLIMVPSTRSTILFEVEKYKTRFVYWLRPPEEQIFVPEMDVATVVAETLMFLQPTATPAPTSTPKPPVSSPAAPTEPPAPTIAATPLPQKAEITGIHYMDQHGLWNYCAPATLGMQLSYWGWVRDREVIGAMIKPYDKDKNVMLYEMADYVQSTTSLHATVRSGGTLDTLKALVANSFPVLVEKGIYIKDYNGRLGWVGHYAVISGYDDNQNVFITQDAYFSANYKVSYVDLEKQWREFNYAFIVLHKPEQTAEIHTLLGPLAQESQAYTVAAERAQSELQTLTGEDHFFAQFNLGTSLVGLQRFGEAAAAYDEAFRLLAELDRKPWRIMWYQTGPYFAYYYTGRSQHVINLATKTIGATTEPYLEESYVWRARARIMLGELDGARQDVKRALELHEGFVPAVELAQQLGLQ